MGMNEWLLVHSQSHYSNRAAGDERWCHVYARRKKPAGLGLLEHSGKVRNHMSINLRIYASRCAIYGLPDVHKHILCLGGGCKNLACLNSKKLNWDCGGCFDIVRGFETQRYVKALSKNDFLIDDVLFMGSGGIRIGFDIGGGSGTFAARMAERNVTVITATLNLDAPFNEFIAARGLFSLYFSLDYRFPFYDNVFDLVHASNGLDVGGRPEKLEFLMFDIDRVLRSGGLFWLDNFYCSTDDKKKTLTRLIERLGYKKLKWIVEPDCDIASALGLYRQESK
ncbi:hypothetical protein ACS0TY_013157 [Phlomoides rotata]